MPTWVTHILDIRDKTASTIHSSNFSQFTNYVADTEGEKPPITPVLPPNYEVDGIVVDMKDVNVTYGTREVNQPYDRS